MKTKELLEKLENKNVYQLVWAIWWRMVVAYLGIYLGAIILAWIISAGIN